MASTVVPVNTMTEMTDQWQETSPGVWQRKACPMECWMRMRSRMDTSDKMHLTLSVTIRLQLAIHPMQFADDLLRAWKTIRRDHGTLASLLDRVNKTWMYIAPNDAEIDIWISETFKIVNEPMTATAVREMIPRLKRPTLYFLIASNEIVLKAPPTHIDHKGILLLAGLLLRHATNPNKTEPVFKSIKLSPPYHKTTCRPANTYSDTKKAVKEMKRYCGDLLSMALPTKIWEFDWPWYKPTETKSCTTSLSEVQTKTMLRLIDQESFRYHHAVHAAIACATKKLNINVDSDKYTGVVYSDARGPYCLTGHPAAFFSRAWFPSIQVTDFKSVMRQFKHDYQMIMLNPVLSNVVDEMVGISISRDQQAEFCTAEALLINLGRLDRFMPNPGCEVKVAELDFHCEVLTPAINVFVFIQQNQLTLKACYNNTYHSEAMVARFLEMVMEELHKGFNLPMYLWAE